MSQRKKQGIGRRDFLKTSASATGGLLVVKPEAAFSSSANSRLNLGIIGCGGRGNSVAGDFVEHNDVQVTVLADLFHDRLDLTRSRFDKLQAEKGCAKVSRAFEGASAYQRVVESDVDIVLVTTPPYFHPLHLEAALEAGKHVYLEKPVATDVKGSKKVASLASKADGKVSVDVGFQIRSSTYFEELTKRLHDGAIGDIAMAQGFYFSGDLPRKSRPSMSREEAKIRDWVFDRALGGDIIVEQNVHIIDVFNWVLKSHPHRAEATAARRVRTNIGNVLDQFIVTYYYPNDVRASFISNQFIPQWGPVCMRFFGPHGFSEACYVGGLKIVGKNPWEAGADETPSGKKSEVDPLAARGRSTFSELRWYPPMEAAKGSLSWVFRAKQPESVRTGP